MGYSPKSELVDCIIASSVDSDKDKEERVNFVESILNATLNVREGRWTRIEVGHDIYRVRQIPFPKHGKFKR